LSVNNRSIKLLFVSVCTFLFLVYADTKAYAHGAPNWNPDVFGDRDGAIEVYRDNVGFRGILAEEIRDYNTQRVMLFPDEPRIKQVKTLAEAEVRIHSFPSPDYACGGFALVWIGFDVKDEVGIADGCFDHLLNGDKQPLRGTILHEVMGHLNGIHHHEVCTPEWQQLSVMVSGVNNSGCGVPLEGLGQHDIATLSGPD
jgi:hypothetical protein